LRTKPCIPCNSTQKKHRFKNPNSNAASGRDGSIGKHDRMLSSEKPFQQRRQQWVV
jgi:hypothetical protein